jgi:hypothetical protein
VKNLGPLLLYFGLLAASDVSAEDIIKAQEAEITDMKAWLAKHDDRKK